MPSPHAEHLRRVETARVLCHVETESLLLALDTHRSGFRLLCNSPIRTRDVSTDNLIKRLTSKNPYIVVSIVQAFQTSLIASIRPCPASASGSCGKDIDRQAVFPDEANALQRLMCARTDRTAHELCRISTLSASSESIGPFRRAMQQTLHGCGRQFLMR